MQCWTNVENVGPTLYKCYTNVLCLLGCRRTFSQTLYIYSMLVQCWASVADVGLALKQHWINVLFKQYLVISSVAILMPSICTQQATVGLYLTIPGMRILQLNTSLSRGDSDPGGLIWPQGAFEHQPSKHETLAQRWFTVGPTVNQRWANVSCLLGMPGSRL